VGFNLDYAYGLTFPSCSALPCSLAASCWDEMPFKNTIKGMAMLVMIYEDKTCFLRLRMRSWLLSKTPRVHECVLQDQVQVQFLPVCCDTGPSAMSGLDFIPLDSSRRPSSSPGHLNGAADTMAKGKKKKRLVSDSFTWQLKERVWGYLDANRTNEYVDVEEMTKELYANYPEYGRRKLNVFKRQVNDCFNKVIVSSEPFSRFLFSFTIIL